MAGPVASINLVQMQSLITSLNSALANLPYDQWGLNSILNSVDLDTSPANPVSDVIIWIGNELPGLNRRLNIARALEAASPTKLATVTFDEALANLTDAQAKALGQKDAKALTNGKQLDPELLAEIATYEDDPYFAQGFASSLTPAQLAQAVLQASRQRDLITQYPGSNYQDQLAAWQKKYGQLLSAVGQTIGTATSNTGSTAMPAGYAQQWVNTITQPTPDQGGRGQYGQGAAAALLLKYGNYNSSFVNSVSVGVYNYEQTNNSHGPLWYPRSNPAGAGMSYMGPYLPDGSKADDPLADVMGALGNNPVAAQQFFSQGGTTKITVTENGQQVTVDVNSRLKYLLQDRTWQTKVGSDDGAGLGAAVLAASTTFRNNQANGARSATIAAQTFVLVGSKTTGDGRAKTWAGMNLSVAKMIASYAPDVIRGTGKTTGYTYDPLGAGWTQPSGPGFPPGGPTGASIDPDFLKSILATLGSNQDDVNQVLAGMAAASKLWTTYALSKDNGDKTFPNATSAVGQSSAATDWVINSGFLGDVSSTDAAKKKAAMQSKVLGMILAMPVMTIPVGGAWTGYVLDQAKDYVIDKAGDGPDNDPQGDFNALNAKTKQGLVRATMNELLQAGYFGSPAQLNATYPGLIGTSGAPSFNFSGGAYDDFSKSPASSQYQTWINANVLTPYGFYDPSEGGGH